MSRNNNNRDNAGGSSNPNDDDFMDDIELQREAVATEAALRSDIISLISRLIQSGEVRVLPGSAPHDSSDDDLDEDYGGFLNRHSLRPHKVVGSPDTSIIDGSDFKQQILQHSGRLELKEQSHFKHKDFLHNLAKREHGLSGGRSFSASDKCQISSNLIPNTTELVRLYKQKAFCGVYSEDGNVFLTASQDHNVRIYDSSGDSLEEIKKIGARDVGWSIIDTAFSPDGRMFIYSSWSDYVHICNIRGDHEIHKALDMNPRNDRFCCFSLEFTKDNREFIGGANDGCLYIYDLETEQRVSRIEAHDDDVDSVALADSTSQIIYSGGDDGLIKVWDRRTLDESCPVAVGVLAGHTDGITYIDSKGDARYLLSNSKDQSMKLWDIRCFSTKDAQEQTKQAVSNQTWDYRWQKFPHKVQYREKTVEGDTSLMTYCGHSVLNTLIRCHFSPLETTAQQYVYTGCATGNIVIYDVLTGEKVQVLKGHTSCCRDVSWHPHLPIIMSASWDCSIRRSYVKSQQEDSDLSSSDTDDDEEEKTPSGGKWSRRKGGRLRQLRNSFTRPRSRRNEYSH